MRMWKAPPWLQRVALAAVILAGGASEAVSECSRGRDHALQPRLPELESHPHGPRLGLGAGRAGMLRRTPVIADAIEHLEFKACKKSKRGNGVAVAVSIVQGRAWAGMHPHLCHVSTGSDCHC